MVLRKRGDSGVASGSVDAAAGSGLDWRGAGDRSGDVSPCSVPGVSAERPLAFGAIC